MMFEGLKKFIKGMSGRNSISKAALLSAFLLEYFKR